jgi:hypothetical protein
MKIHVNMNVQLPFPETYNLNLKKVNGELIKDPYSWNEETLTWDLDTNTN